MIVNMNGSIENKDSFMTIVSCSTSGQSTLTCNHTLGVKPSIVMISPLAFYKGGNKSYTALDIVYNSYLNENVRFCYTTEYERPGSGSQYRSVSKYTIDDAKIYLDLNTANTLYDFKGDYVVIAIP